MTMYDEFLKWAGWIAAIVIFVLGYLERRQDRLERRQERDDDRLGRTFEYFFGGSQRRSVGIALIEGLWANKPRHHDVLVPLVANQIVYLLLSTESHDAHNERNLVRMFKILTSNPNLKERYTDRWGDVCVAIHRKLAGDEKGIPVSSRTLKAWMKDIGCEVGA